MTNDLLIEILTEELPPKVLHKLSSSFAKQIAERLQKANITLGETQAFATPRRLAVLIHDVANTQPGQKQERRGPALQAAFDSAGNPTLACIGFAKSCGVNPDELTVIKTEQGEWVGYSQDVEGKTLTEILPRIIEEAALALPIPKRMRWGNGDTEFIRPVHSVLVLHGDMVIAGKVLGCETGRVTHGHRFHAPQAIIIPHASTYASLLETEGHIIANFIARRELIKKEINHCVQQKLNQDAHAVIDTDLLDEVTGLVEWPLALCGSFDEEFLQLPPEVLVSSMQDHQRYFPVMKQNKLLANFVTVINIQTSEPERVLHGNERVLRARLSDAAFFYDVDKKEPLESRIGLLHGILYHAKLGTLYEKTERVAKLSEFIANKLGGNDEYAYRAGMLAKTDLTTAMVGEFPELQGTMGKYYALHDNEPYDIALALLEQYLPRFAGDKLPSSLQGEILGLADRIDLLVGYFGINQLPTGDKDPYGLRRAALAILRILIEDEIDLDLRDVLAFSRRTFSQNLANTELETQILSFMQERLRAWYLEQHITADVFAAVSALSLSNPLDIHQRIKAVQAFKKLSEAETLSIANKRVSNILSKYVDPIAATVVNPDFFESEHEKELATKLAAKKQLIDELAKTAKYEQILFQLAELRTPIDNFFDHVMVMTEDKNRRENRLLLLSQLRALFLEVADIALLQ